MRDESENSESKEFDEVFVKEFMRIGIGSDLDNSSSKKEPSIDYHEEYEKLSDNPQRGHAPINKRSNDIVTVDESALMTFILKLFFQKLSASALNILQIQNYSFRSSSVDLSSTNPEKFSNVKSEDANGEGNNGGNDDGTPSSLKTNRIKSSPLIEEKIDILLCEQTAWQNEITKRIEMVFERTKSDYESSPLIRLPRSAFSTVKKELKCKMLLQILAITIPDHGIDARIVFILNSIAHRISLTLEDYVEGVERQLEVQLKLGKLTDQQDLTVQSTRGSRIRRNVLIGMGAIGGALLLGVTAGMAVPAMVPWAAGLFGASAGATAFWTGTTGAALFGIVFGAGGAGLGGYRVQQRYRDIKDFTFVPIVDDSHLRVTICISGWLRNDSDLIKPWAYFCGRKVDLFVMDCEREAFKKLGRALSEVITDSAVSFAAMNILRTTALATALAALSWPITIIQAGNLIDNPWSVCINISGKAGLILADAIKNRAQGHRPITLVGYSLGALMIFQCLLELARDPAGCLGIIENVVLFGLPATLHPISRWILIRSLVAGRFIHCYSKNDWVLKFLYRSTALSAGEIAGLNAIEGVEGIENVNMSEFVKGHLEYSDKMDEMLAGFGL